MNNQTERERSIKTWHKRLGGLPHAPAPFTTREHAMCAEIGDLRTEVERLRRSTNASPQGDDLPPLPKCRMLVGHHFDSLHVLYTADQMREYGAACRASAGAADALDAARLDWLVDDGAYIEIMAGPLYRVRWPDRGEWQRDWSKSAREAIDAARNTQPGRAAEGQRSAP